MQTLNSISKRYQINQHGEAYYTLTLTSLTTGKEDTALVFGDLETIVSNMEATIYDLDPDADPAEYRAVISHKGTQFVIMPTCAGPDNAVIVAPRPAAHTYEVREIDALPEYETDDPDEVPTWTYNDSYRLGEFATASKDVGQAMRRYLKQHCGVTFYRGRTRTEYDGDVWEIVDRSTRQPLFAAIPME